MEPQPETATVLVCGTAIPVTAEELELAGLQVKGPEAFSALSRLVNLRTITLSKMTFSDAGWESLVAGIKGSPHLTHLNLTACGLGPKHAADLAGIFSSGGCNITTLCLAKNDALTGKRSRDNDNAAPWIYGEKMEGWVALCSALPSTMISLDFSGCALKPKSLTPLTDAIAKMAAVKNINLSGCPLAGAKKIRGNWNEIDSDMTGFIALCGVLGKLHEINMSDCGLGAASAGEFAKAVSDADAAIVSINCLQNNFGDEGLSTLLSAIKGTSVRSLCGLTEGQTIADFSGQNLGPFDCKIMAAESAFSGFIAAVNSLTVDSTGDMQRRNGGPKTYTLTAGDVSIDLSSKNLGSADIALLTAWLQRPEVSAALSERTLTDSHTG